jgi:hypothetical protein
VPTEFNYVVNLDTSRVMGAVSEIRSQVGMALGSPTGFGSPAMGIGGPGAAMMGVSDFGGGAMQGMAMMQAGFARPPFFMGPGGMLAGNSFGGTFTNPAMAYTPHYGSMMAESQLSQELLVGKFGLGAANLLRPPGVGAGEYASAMGTAHAQRQVGAVHDALSAARSSVVSTAAGMAGGWAGGAIGGWVGAGIGGLIGGPVGAGIGMLAGQIGGDLLGFNVVSDLVQSHYAQIEQIGGVTTELGNILGAGRGMGHRQRYDLGRAARMASKDLGMDVQEMGEILALARQNGMMPGSSDPDTLRKQARDLASAVDDVASVLHTSLSNASGLIQSMNSMGFGAREGAIKMAGMGASVGMDPMAVFGIGMAGAGIARQNLLSSRQGFDLFTGGLMQAAGAPLSREELSMVGGVSGLGQTIATTQMAQALGPMGDLQLLAASGGRPLGNVFDVGASAMGALGQGGDFVGNLIHFQTHKRELLRGVGASGIRAMAHNQMEGWVDIMAGMGGNRRDWELTYAENVLGMNEVQAKGFIGGRGGGGGGGGAVFAAELQAAQTLDVAGRARAGRRGAGGFAGRMANSGDARIARFAMDGVGEAASQLGEMGLGWDVESSADEEFISMNARIDAATGRTDRRLGTVRLNQEVAARVATADMNRVYLNADAMGNPVAATYTAAGMILSGANPTAAGMGTVQAGGQYWSAADAQRIAAHPGARRHATSAEQAAALASAHSVRSLQYSEQSERDILSFASNYEKLFQVPKADDPGSREAFLKNSSAVRAQAVNLIGRSGNQALARDFQQHGFTSDYVMTYLRQLTGHGLQDLSPATLVGVGLVGSAESGAVGGPGLRDYIYDHYAKGMLGSDALGARMGYSQDLAMNEKFRQGMLLYEHGNQKRGEALMIQADLEVNLKHPELHGPGMGNFLKGGFASELAKDKARNGQFRTSSDAGGRFSQSGIPMTENAVGFGQQETAMSSINRSLMATESMLKTLNAKINPQGSPSGKKLGG